MRIAGSERGWRKLFSDGVEAKVGLGLDALRGATQVGRGGKLGVTWVDGPHPKTSDSPLDTPKVFIHGAGGNPRNFDKMIDELRKAGHRNIAVVKFSMMTEPVTQELEPGAKDAIVDVIQSAAKDFQAAGFSSGVLIGHSYGGALALEVAHANREAWSDIVAIGGFLANFENPGPGATGVMKGLAGVGKALHIDTLTKNLDYGHRPDVQAQLESPASIAGTRLTTISSEHDGFVGAKTAQRADAAVNYVLPDESHLGLPASPTVISALDKILRREPVESAPE